MASSSWRSRIDRTILCHTRFLGRRGFLCRRIRETFVIKPGEDMEIVAINDVAPESNEIFRASITPSNGQLFLRSDRVLYCIGDQAQP